MSDKIRDKIDKLKCLIVGGVTLFSGTAATAGNASEDGKSKVKAMDEFVVAKSVEQKEIIPTLLFYEGCVNEAYKCEAGVSTVGIGITKFPNGEPIPANYKIKSQQELTDLVTAHLKREIYPALKTYVKRHLDDNELVALVSLCYNCGVGVLGKNGKPSLLTQAVNSKNRNAVVSEFLKYIYITKKNKKTHKSRKVMSNSLGVRRCGELYCYLGLLSAKDMTSFYIGGQRGLDFSDFTVKLSSGKYGLRKDLGALKKFKDHCRKAPSAEECKKFKLPRFGGDKTVYEYITQVLSNSSAENRVRSNNVHTM